MEINFHSISALIIIGLSLVGLLLTNILLPKIHIGKRITLSTFWLVSLIGAILLICFQDVSLKHFYEIVSSNTAVNPLKVIGLFFAMTFLSVFLDEIGFFSYLATLIANKVNKSQFLLFFIFFVLISVLTVFTSNDIIILTFTPFLCYFCKRSNIDPIPYLMMEFIAANTMSMCLIIGNPTNIYLATSFNIDFITYFKNMIIPTIVAALIAFVLLSLLFFKKLKTPLQKCDEATTKPNTFLLIVGLVILLTTTVMLAISSYIGVEMWLIAVIGFSVEFVFAFIYSLVKKTHLLIGILKRLPYNLLPFIISMFLFVLSLNEIGFNSVLSNWLYQGSPVFTFGYSGLLSANLINNIPMSLLYSDLLNTSNTGAIYASIASSNIAAYVSPLGALAGLMFIALCQKNDVKISFLTFVKYGAIVALPTITITLLLINTLIK